MYDNIIIGAGYWAVGFCEANKGNNLIISDSVYLDDFSSCLRRADLSYQTVRGAHLYREFEQAGLIRGTILDVVGAACCLYQIAEQLDLTILYQTLVSEVTDRSVTVHNDEGSFFLEAKRVIDLRVPKGRCFWNMIVKGENADCLEHFNPHYRTLHLPVEGDFACARRQFEEYRLAHPELRYVMSANFLEDEGRDDSPFQCYEQGFEEGSRQQ